MGLPDNATVYVRHTRTGAYLDVQLARGAYMLLNIKANWVATKSAATKLNACTARKVAAACIALTRDQDIEIEETE